ncbi:NAD(P)H oxidoreductase [Paenibacillus barcinonensis]|uniref:NAD(P)H oxidoreductase n=1 Tax=Paenibacillus barcinonensis TaxID=198119 RepID=A0A2V4V7N7_PAEBA|nr:NAD(P)H oxidoreductase [Paenibacillus barcinonensis]PYE47841.1 putative NADPH-quinone reductase [Paenibacillus barcinonensis]QKS59064.1 NAD(P)H oxidoreductase [Paenibacillus barcinonensis]
MNVLVVVSHSRKDSLTFQVTDRFIQGLAAGGHQAEIVDLHEIGFDPILRAADEPDYSQDIQRFSPQIETEIKRLKKHDAIAFVFPLWWWHLPAMLKGYIDRVMNNGYAYGANKLHHQQILWIALAGVTEEQMNKRSYSDSIRNLLNVGIADYCGVCNSRVEFLYNTLEAPPEHYEELLHQAYALGVNYASHSTEPLTTFEK